MDDYKLNCKGSPSRDAFKWWHKHLIETFYACDLDFVLVEKDYPGIVAILDYKQPGDTVTFSEALAYNRLMELGLSVFIVESEWHPDEDEQFQEFKIFRYVGADWRPKPPEVGLELVAHIAPPPGPEARGRFARWEKELRQKYRLARQKEKAGL